MATANGFKWDALFLDNLPISTPNYANNDKATGGQTLGRPLTNYATSMARLALIVTNEERTALKAQLPDLVTLIDRLSGSSNQSFGQYGYIDFLLQSATHSFRENIAVTETLDDLYSGYAFGQTPAVFQYSVALLNNKQDQQAHKMFLIYRELLRSHALAHHKTLCHMIYDGYLVSGYLQDFSSTIQADNESVVTAQFSLLVKSCKLTNPERVRTGNTFNSGVTEILVQPSTTQTQPSRQAAVVSGPPAAAPVEVGS